MESAWNFNEKDQFYTIGEKLDNLESFQKLQKLTLYYLNEVSKYFIIDVNDFCVTNKHF
jgi:predicted RNA-binding protein Jag